MLLLFTRVNSKTDVFFLKMRIHGYLFYKAHLLVQKIKIKLLRQQKLIFSGKKEFFIDFEKINKYIQN
jgi:hypothetical protein